MHKKVSTDGIPNPAAKDQFNSRDLSYIILTSSCSNQLHSKVVGISVAFNDHDRLTWKGPDFKNTHRNYLNHNFLLPTSKLTKFQFEKSPHHRTDQSGNQPPACSILLEQMGEAWNKLFPGSSLLNPHVTD